MSQPPARAETSAVVGKILPVGWIEKSERERLNRMSGTEPGGVAAEDTGRAAKPERGDVLAQQCARLGALVDEQRKRRAA